MLNGSAPQHSPCFVRSTAAMQSQEQDVDTYIVRELDPIIQEMVLQILNSRPSKPLDFLIGWLLDWHVRTLRSHSQCVDMW